MGLDTSHGCYHGGCFTFNLWREAIGAATGWYLDRTPTPELPQGAWYYGDGSVEVPEDDPIRYLLSRNDCEDPDWGIIEASMTLPLAEVLEAVVYLIPDAPKELQDRPLLWLPGYYRSLTWRFAAGLRKAHASGEPVIFK